MSDVIKIYPRRDRRTREEVLSFNYETCAGRFSSTKAELGGTKEIGIYHSSETEALTSVTVKNAVFWNMAARSLVKICRRFRETCCLHLLSASTSRTSVNLYQITHRWIPQNSNNLYSSPVAELHFAVMSELWTLTMATVTCPCRFYGTISALVTPDSHFCFYFQGYLTPFHHRDCIESDGINMWWVWKDMVWRVRGLFEVSRNLCGMAEGNHEKNSG